MEWKNICKSTFSIFISSITLLLSFNYIYSAQDYADIIIILDNSGSMKKNDPKFLMVEAVKSFILKLPKNDSLGLIIFSDKAELVSSLTLIYEDQKKDEIIKELSKVDYSGKFTDIPLGIERGLRELKQNGRKDSIKFIIFLTDGIIDTGNKEKDKERYLWLKDSLLSDYIKNQIYIISIAFTEQADYQLIQEIAQKTSGEYYTALKSSDLASLFEKIFLFIDSKRIVERNPKEIIYPNIDLQDKRSETPPTLIKREIENKQFKTPSPEDEDKPYWGISLMLISIFLSSTIIIVIIIFGIKLLKLSEQNKLKKDKENEKLPEIPYASLVDLANVTGEKEFVIRKHIINIGRIPKGNDLIIKDGKVSQYHAQIEYKSGAFYIRDVGSTNGTYINDEKLEGETLLKNGVVISFANYKFAFKRGDENFTLIDENLIKTKLREPKPLIIKEKNLPTINILDQCKCPHINLTLVTCHVCKKANYCSQCVKDIGGKKICPDCLGNF